MQNPSIPAQEKIRIARERLELLQELDLLETEFQLIRNEYTQRKRNLEERLSKTDA